MLGNLRRFSKGIYRDKLQLSPALRGRLDQCDADLIRGWVLGRKSYDKASIKVYADGNLTIEKRADEFRQDLLDAGIGDGYCSFSIDVRSFLADGLQHEIGVTAETTDGRKIEFESVTVKSKLEVKPQDKLQGRLDNPLPGRIRGWVLVEGLNEAKPYVEIFINDELVETVCADRLREDVLNKRGGDGFCGFEIPIPIQYVNGFKHRISARVIGENGFQFSPRDFKQLPEGMPGKTTVNFSPRKRKEGYRGNIDSPRQPNVLVGWASTDPNAGENGCEISIYIDGRFIAKENAKIYRKDLENHGVNSGYAGFEYAVPAELVDGKEHEVEIRDISGEFYICSKTVELKDNREFTDFEGFLKWSFFHREVTAPFREEDKRCFAYMDWLEKFDYGRYSKRFSDKIDQPLVSVVMPTYNRGHVIGKAIQSVLNQSYENWELLIVDDASSDNTRDVVESFRDSRIKFNEIKENCGVSVARNRALELSRGDYICYLDSDNDWSRKFLTLVVGNLEECCDFDCAYTAQYLYKNSERPYAVRFGPFNRTLLENRNHIDMNAFVHRRSLYERKGEFDVNLKRLVDWDLILRYTEDKKPLAIKNILSNYYYSDGEETITVSESLEDAVGTLKEKRLRLLKEMDLDFRTVGYASDGESVSAPVTSADPAKMHSQQEMGASIIIVSFNIPKILRACVESVIRTTDQDRAEIIIVDNCSDQETVDLVRDLNRHNNVKTVFNKENLGFTAAVNQGIKLTNPHNNIVILNNDAIATRGWLSAMEQVVVRNADAGIVAPQQVLFPHTRTINTHVPYANVANEVDVTVSYHHSNLELGTLNSSQPEFEVNFIPFFCVYITRDTLDKVGLLDEKLGRHYRSDRLYCYAARYQGEKKIYFTPKSKLYHLHQQSTAVLKKKDSHEFNVMFVKNSWGAKDKPLWDH